MATRAKLNGIKEQEKEASTNDLEVKRLRTSENQRSAF